MPISTLLSTLLLLFTITPPVLSVQPIVTIGTTKYKGRTIADGTTQWLGIRYAQPPLGPLRFQPPQKLPLTNNQTDDEPIDASKFAPICLPNSPTDYTTRPNARYTIAEDCLYLNIFAPTNATPTSNLPVLFFIQGGGFASNSNSNYNGSSLARALDMVVVSINYRVGVYGFLHTRFLGKGGLNVGIRDQIAALEWVGEWIGRFGGDPRHVVVDGDSAGAASVNVLVASPVVRKAGGVGERVRGVVVESTYQNMYRTVGQGESGLACILKETGCWNQTGGGEDGDGGLACLRGLEARKLQSGCGFGPGIDQEVIPLRPFEAFEKGEYLKVPAIFGSCTDEGTKNVPQSTDTIDDVHAYVLSQCPSLTNASLAVLDRMYIHNKTEPVFPNSGRLWRHGSYIHGDMRSHCVDKIFQDILVRDGVPTWTYRYGVRDPTHEAQGFGAYHVVELYAIWGHNNTDNNPPKSYIPGGENAGIVDEVRGYWGSFIRNLDPSVERKVGSPEWKRRGIRGERLFFGGSRGTWMEGLEGEERWRCGVVDPLVRAMEREVDGGERTEVKWRPRCEWGRNGVRNGDGNGNGNGLRGC